MFQDHHSSIDTPLGTRNHVNGQVWDSNFEFNPHTRCETRAPFRNKRARGPQQEKLSIINKLNPFGPLLTEPATAEPSTQQAVEQKSRIGLGSKQMGLNFERFEREAIQLFTKIDTKRLKGLQKAPWLIE